MQIPEEQEIIKQWDDEGDVGNVLLDHNIDIEDLKMIATGNFNHIRPYGLPKIGIDGHSQWYNSLFRQYASTDSTISRSMGAKLDPSRPETRNCTKCGMKILRNERHRCDI